MLPAAVTRLLRRQDGVLTRAQARAAGLSDRQITARIRTGEWAIVHRGVLRRADTDLSAFGRSRAAVLWAGSDAVLSGIAAAHWLGLIADLPLPIEVVVPADRHPVARPGIRIVRRRLDAVDVRAVRGLRVLAVPMATLRAAVALGDRGTDLLDRQLQRGLPFARLHQAYCRQIGWRGSATAHRLMATAGDGAAAASERLLVSLFRSAGLTGWQLNAEVIVNGRRYHPDFSFDRRRLAIEVDGWAWHSTPDRFRADRMRDNDFLLAGWRVLRFTWYDLTRRPDAVVRTVREALAIGA
jgi:very-short-patch-repair endonuclease